METPPDTELKGVLISLSGPVVRPLAALPFFGLARLDRAGRRG
ncbi:MAG: hypothetical protein WDM85_15595 [Caulobacteraceae bacterium]